jgi:chaperone modulatory protein CbpM
MFATREFLVRTRLDARTLKAWIEAGWLVPRRNGDGERFSEVDFARAKLIRDLKKAMGVNDEGVTVILDLIDQVHGLRRTLRELLSAIHAQSETMRRQIAAEILAATSPYRNGDGPDRPAVMSSSQVGRHG